MKIFCWCILVTLHLFETLQLHQSFDSNNRWAKIKIFFPLWLEKKLTTNDAAMATSPGSNQDGVLQTNFCPECRNASRLLFSIRSNSVCRKTNGGIWCQSNGHLQMCKTFTKIALHGQWLWLRWESGHIRNQRSAVQAPPYWKFLQSESIRQLQRKDSWKNCR